MWLQVLSMDLIRRFGNSKIDVDPGVARNLIARGLAREIPDPSPKKKNSTTAENLIFPELE